MKIQFLYLAIMLQVNILVAVTVGTIPFVLNMDTAHQSTFLGYVYADVIPYVTGGITVTYPVNFYAQAPSVLITLVLKNRAYSTTEFLVAEVVSNSATSTTIRVNIAEFSVLPTVGEANTDDVEIHFRAIGI